jgi:hypothetical protein
MNITNISTNVQAILESSDVFAVVDEVKQVIPAPQEGESIQFDGYPAAFHYYENTESNPATVSQNRRVINYTVQIVIVTPDTVTSTEEFATAYSTIDTLIQKFDESRDLSIEGSLPRACDIMRPVPGELTRVSTNLGDGLMATIRLACEADIKFRNS